MSKVRIDVHERGPHETANGIQQTRAVLDRAGKEAASVGKLNIVFITAENGNVLSVVVGSDETVLGFTFAHLDPPYFVSKGGGKSEHPALTAFVSLEHHTEFPRRWVISKAEGMRGVEEFIASGDLPTSITWAEP